LAKQGAGAAIRTGIASILVWNLVKRSYLYPAAVKAGVLTTTNIQRDENEEEERKKDPG
jgi:hypothetical protein